ncbi:MAG: hypothetical protein A3J65_03040 [Candidatus Buchananbacteria bacterium RIFCSPHIGHO2_02_FULL_45_11b]|uniref:DUF8128 domain-containing protein n=2 Tax=Candidatus Buchananiibacteriota TaxID=1817903 RepID=A0A1G1YE16_9BACT|nr:MAG: hypothetical protein A3J65_03040 [Candidatus Buchananbacteria bacterium RIFCSPHIGHO2_02_FULL_45_11b]OGY56296.1 MAG: hypothetical protein A3H67_02660 [Candidatus Buchananbacteria bacterium RIFCSPLOWO2_02_FULL_46_11b]
MNIVIDFSSIPTDSPIAFGWWFFKTIGWIYPVFLFTYALILFWQLWLRNNYRRERKYMMVAVDVPKNIENGPKGVENIFNQLAGAHQPLKVHEKWWTGEIPNSFSFEIASFEGYIQFFIHFEQKYRDLIEAIVYAQYPEAEIMEVEDYTKDWRLKFPSEKYNLWGTELKLAKKEYYPIRTYEEFEHVEGFVDPMAGILEALTRIGPGEQVWIQLVVTPADNDWGKGAENLIIKLSGGKVERKKTIFDRIFDIPGIVWELLNPVLAAPSTKKDEPYNLMMNLTPGQKDVINAIEKKTGKLGFHTKIRLIYFAEKDKFVKPKANAIYGAFKQFNTLDLNSVKPDAKTLTGGIVFFKKRRVIARQNKIFYRYKNRGHWLEPGSYGKILNSQELASLYHFPIMTVKAPMVKKSEAKKAEPPMTLPVSRSFISPRKEKPAPVKPEEAAPAQIEKTALTKAGPPANLPIG